MRAMIIAVSVLLGATASAAAKCERLPFKLPSAKVSAEWGDAEFEAWERQQWAEFCEPKHKSAKLAAAMKSNRARTCECRPR